MPRELIISDTDNIPISGVPKNVFAIYNSGASGTDHSGASDPVNNPDKVTIHSDLKYLGVQNKLSFSQALPAHGWTPTVNAPTTNSYTLGAHGVVGKPLVLARFRNASGPGAWKTINGATYAEAANAVVGWGGHLLMLQVDATNVILRTSSWQVASAMTIDIEVFILDRKFDDTAAAKTLELFYADETQVRAAGGRFNTTKQYLQGTTGTADIYAHTGQTWLAQNDTYGQTIGTYTDITGNVALECDSRDTPPAAFNTLTPHKLILPASPTGINTKLSDTEFSVKNQLGEDIFNSQNQLVAVLSEHKFDIASPARATNVASVQTVQHHSVSVSAGANLIFGWLEVVSAGAIVLSSKPIDFSGSVPITFSNITVQTGPFDYVLTTVLASIYSAKLVANSLVIEEQWWNWSSSLGGGLATPAITLRAHVMVCALTGGGF